MLQIYIGELLLIHITSLKSVCRWEFIARPAVNFQFPILIVSERGTLYTFVYLCTFYTFDVYMTVSSIISRHRLSTTADWHCTRGMEETAFSSFPFAEQCHFDLSHRGYVFQNLLPISVRKIPYKDGRSTRKFRAVISR